MEDVWTYRDSSSLGSNLVDTKTDLSGFKVEALDGSIGSIDEATYGTTRSYIVVDTGPWIFGKKVILPAGVIRGVDETDERVYVEPHEGRDQERPGVRRGDAERRHVLQLGRLALRPRRPGLPQLGRHVLDSRRSPGPHLRAWCSRGS